MNILAIETSCDETSVAIVENGNTLHSLVVNSQIDIHAAFGGVIPEIAARSHIEVMIPVIEQGLQQADMTWSDIDAIAVTQGPGLLGSLLIGVVTARTLAWSLDKPLYPIHHILGHIYANWITKATPDALGEGKKQLVLPEKEPEFPVLALIVSGGHSQIMYGRSHTDWRVIGRTQDDAVGEAFDKVAKVLGLPYPGGPSLSKAAESGDPPKYKLPMPSVHTIDPGLADLRTETNYSPAPSTKIHLPKSSDTSYNFSFSGLKTAVLRAVQKEVGVAHDFPSFELAEKLNQTQIADFAASFQAKAVEYLVSKTAAAYHEFHPKTVIIGGGVAASQPLRQALSEAIPIPIEYAPHILCTDNAAMIGVVAHYASLTTGPSDPHSVEVKPSWPL